MSDRQVQILDHRGAPIPRRRRAMSMLNAGNTQIAYDAADVVGDHFAAWTPYLGSPDNDLNFFRDRIVARVRDLVRNDGWASGAVTRILDNAIGATFRPIAKPDYRALQAMTGLKTFDAQWASEYGRAVEANFRTWANDPAKYCDVERAQTFSQMQRLGFRHKIVDGDALAVMSWLPARVSPGRARYATAVHVIDPDRLSNPMLVFDTLHMRGGCEVDENGATIAYHFREAHQGDWWAGAKSITWTRVPREKSWGRPVVVHDFDRDRASQHRGGAGVLTPVIMRLRMLAKYDTAELDAALVNAIFSAYIESPFDHSMLQDMLGETDLSAYQSGRADFHDERRLVINGNKIPTLYPGEKMGQVNPARPAGNFPEFESAVLRNAAGALGLSAQQMSNNWSDVNYSSARGAMLEAWKTLTRRRTDFAIGYSQPIFACWLEEAHEVDDLPLPAGAPEYYEARAAYSAARWIGPPKGWIDPVAEMQGAFISLSMGLSTLQDEAADQGVDYEENLDQRQREQKDFEDRNLTMPAWSGQVVQPPAPQMPMPAKVGAEQ